jgi:Ca2+-binding EF-hand superfamily protein
MVVKIHALLNKLAVSMSTLPSQEDGGEPGAPKLDYGAIFASMDKDGDGTLTIDEFIRGLTKLK